MLVAALIIPFCVLLLRARMRFLSTQQCIWFIDPKSTKSSVSY